MFQHVFHPSHSIMFWPSRCSPSVVSTNTSMIWMFLMQPWNKNRYFSIYDASSLIQTKITSSGFIMASQNLYPIPRSHFLEACCYQNKDGWTVIRATNCKESTTHGQARLISFKEILIVLFDTGKYYLEFWFKKLHSIVIWIWSCVLNIRYAVKWS